jgi:hypothetical protein
MYMADQYSGAFLAMTIKIIFLPFLYINYISLLFPLYNFKAVYYGKSESRIKKVAGKDLRNNMDNLFCFLPLPIQYDGSQDRSL